MKAQSLFKRIAISLLSLVSILSYSQDTAEVSVSFIGSHGYLLESSAKKVSMDALIYWEGDNYGYIKPPVELTYKMQEAESPYDSLDLILIGHAHSDHYNSEIIERAMLKNENAVLVATPSALQDIEAHVDSFSFYSDRIWSPELDFYQSADTIINEIPLTITSIPHGAQNMELYVPAFELDSIRFVQLNGWNSLTAQAYDTLGFNKERADVIFLCYSYILDNAKNALFKQCLHPLFSTISHVDGASVTRLNQIQDSILNKRNEYPMNMLTIPMEQLLYKKINDTILVDTLNNAPTIISGISNQETFVNELFSFTLPDNLFSDKEGDPVSVTVSSINGGPIPSWLSYNPETRVLEGTPASITSPTIRVNGTDSHFATRSFTFKIMVKATIDINSQTGYQINIFPNPASEEITFQLDKEIAEYSIINISGIVEQQGFVRNLETLDISKLHKGLYVINIKSGEYISNQIISVE